MSYEVVKKAFFVKKNGKFTHIDIAVCTNCNGIHIPPEEASGCSDTNFKIMDYEELKRRFDDLRKKESVT